jgi:hypothetical protein
MPIKTWSETKEKVKRLLSWNRLRRDWFFKYANDWLNIIDDYPDWVKEKLHGMHLPFGYELNISFLMVNRKTTWDIIRKQGDYDNSDPEDRSDYVRPNGE